MVGQPVGHHLAALGTGDGLVGLLLEVLGPTEAHAHFPQLDHLLLLRLGLGPVGGGDGDNWFGGFGGFGLGGLPILVWLGFGWLGSKFLSNNSG